MKSVLATALFIAFSQVVPFAYGEIDYSRDIRPILSKNCFFCHGPDAHERKADLRLDSYEGAIEDRDGSLAIDPNDLANSEFIHRIKSTDPDDIMPTPKSHKKLTPEEIALLTEWVEAGAPYADHWAFVPPTSPEPPESNWGATYIDHFINAKLAEAGIQPSKEADPHTLIRRASLDLTGLPPTPERVEKFVEAHAVAPEASYKALVDELLDSEHFGERMALAWMDAARYGDSSVMHADGPRDMWPWRDWVIDAYNDNKPFSDFLREQIAGDLIPNATFDQKVASGFNRNHATSDEGGAFAEELRVEYVVDRVQTTSNVFLGLSMECAQCHDHKYDPISQKEYFGFYAFFNNTTDPGMQTRRGNQTPVVNFTVGGDQEKAAEIDAKAQQLDQKLGKRRKAAQPELAAWLAKTTPQNIVGAEPKGIVRHFPLEPDTKLPLSSDDKRKIMDKGGRKFLDLHHSNDAPIVLEGTDTPDLDISKPFTFSTYVHLIGSTLSHSAIASRMGEDFRGWDIWVENSRIGTHLVDKWPGNALKITTKDKLANGWQHVAISYDGSRKAAGVKIFVNGKSVPVSIHTDKLKPDATNDLPKETHPFLIGSRPSNGALFYGRLDDIRFYNCNLPPAEVAALHIEPLKAALATAQDQRKPEQNKLIADHFFAHVDKPHQELTTQKEPLLAERAVAMKGSKDYTSMIMQDNVPDKMRMTYVLDRGAYDMPKEEEVIPPHTPAFLPPMPEGAPVNRLGLADWMLQEDHPLTARVAVNRYWTMLFGQGLTPSVMDFGNQGQSPSHPELLDWMAKDFIASGWDIKHALRQIVTSSTYRQNAAIDSARRTADPENLLLSRSPRFRLQGDHIRDLALSASGLLVQHVGGPGTKPYQPEGLWNEVSLNKGVRFVQDKGDDLYRKSMYIYWKRSSPHPGMTIFDAPTREKCTVQRARTNTPLQALVTLNDVQFVEASRKLAERMATEGGEEFETRLSRAFQLCVSREPTADEVEICRELFTTQLASFEAEPARAAEYLAHGESEIATTLSKPEHAALTVVANLILNLDETLTRG